MGFYDQSEGYAPGAMDDFFKRLRETSDHPDKPFYMPNGTPFFCTASGILLKKGLSEWDKLPEAQRKPGAALIPEATEDPERVKKSRRLTRPPANTLILRTYVRGLKLDADGRLVAPKIIDWEYNIKLPAEPNRDFMWLRDEEWKSLIPANPVKGRAAPVADAVRDRICLWHIAGGYHGLPGYYSQDLFKSKEMTLEVETATPQDITLRLRGTAALKSGASYQFHGLLKFDPAKKALTRFDLIALCDEGRELKSTPQNVAAFRHYGIVFELAGERTDDLLPPFYLRENVGTPERYFGNTAR